MSNNDPWMLCPACAEAHVVEGHGRDAGRYHCPRCQRCISADYLAAAAYRRGMTTGINAFNAALSERRANPPSPGTGEGET